MRQRVQHRQQPARGRPTRICVLGSVPLRGRRGRKPAPVSYSARRPGDARRLRTLMRSSRLKRRSLPLRTTVQQKRHSAKPVACASLEKASSISPRSFESVRTPQAHGVARRSCAMTAMISADVSRWRLAAGNARPVPRLWTSSFLKMWARWVLTVSEEMNIRSPIWGLVRPSATSSTTLASVGVSDSQPPGGRPRGPRARRAHSSASSCSARRPRRARPRMPRRRSASRSRRSIAAQCRASGGTRTMPISARARSAAANSRTASSS